MATDKDDLGLDAEFGNEGAVITEPGPRGHTILLARDTHERSVAVQILDPTGATVAEAIFDFPAQAIAGATTAAYRSTRRAA